MKIKKTYSFAFWTSLILTFTSLTVFYLSSYFFLNRHLPITTVLIFVAIIYSFSFFIIQYRVEKFINLRIKKIYDNVSLLDASDLNKTAVSADLDKLSREVQQFAKNKQQQIRNLNLREDYRREFLGNISHELKTPLFTVQGYLLTLEDGAMNDKRIGKKYLKRANKGVERLIAIVKDLDLISKLESNNLNLKKQSFNIVQLVQDVFDLLEIEAKKRNVTLLLNKYYEYPIMVIGDIERIEQVLTNLIMNSIKYGKINGATVVSMEAIENSKILIKVKDNGEGIKEEHIDRLFERFYRVDQSRSRDQGGSGLGLSIVKHIIEAHDEQIFVKSKNERGSEFSFTLEQFKAM
ncbi:two-component system, OmpR family, phosphate regulon sensor histidine kinase PhoR [Lutibacter agarilyticus]|uniref:histidine kinase n=1 Tax=Lutibacter agarilyticus TaxID=1109740 RepID=A0A238VZB4_9FLAO|nr:ATP-binding protein [Lutibacter agarilyticus]SNR39660.1 two-component system, OmpR family, phosphate regulon sensor histidine kinase PhoR [Lutibacter agarilyticus]